MKNTRKYYQISFGGRTEKDFVRAFTSETEARFNRKLKKTTDPDHFSSPYHQELIELDYCYIVWSKDHEISITFFPNQGTDGRRFHEDAGDGWLIEVFLGTHWSNPDESILLAQSLFSSLDPEYRLIHEEDPSEVMVTPRNVNE